jgi:muramoyltetrapeptide carboxypeptidase LdcA involved in peptidoglycan recycling
VKHFAARWWTRRPDAAQPRRPDDNLVPRTGRISTLRGGKARGRLVGGNLAVLTVMAGSPYWPVTSTAPSCSWKTSTNTSTASTACSAR